MEDLASHHIHVDNYTRQENVFQVLKPWSGEETRANGEGYSLGWLEQSIYKKKMFWKVNMKPGA